MLQISRASSLPVLRVQVQVPLLSTARPGTDHRSVEEYRYLVYTVFCRNGEEYWLGLKKRSNEVNSETYWIDGNPSAYRLKWKSGEPDSKSPCIAYKGGRLIDKGCDGKKNMRAKRRPVHRRQTG